MDDSVGKDVAYFGLQFWSTIAVALAVYIGGVTTGRVVTTVWPGATDLVSGKTRAVDPRLPMLFRLWYATRSAHPLVVGGLIGLIPMLPHPDFVTSRTSSVLWFAGSGMANGQVHLLVEAAFGQARRILDLVVPWLRQRLGLPPAASTPSAPATDPMPTTTTPLADTLEPPGDDKK